MRPFTRTIIDLFDGKRRYLIPLYQRQYAWKVSPQLELLWFDIERSANSLEEAGKFHAPHFMGAIVIAQLKTFGKQVQAFEVIDGQQRLTTFQLLLAAFRDVAIDLSPEYAAEIAKYLLNDGVMEIPSVERFKLWPSLVDRAAFTRLIDTEGVGAPAEHLIEDDEGVRPATAAYDYFVDVIRKHVCKSGSFDSFRMEKLFESLKDGLAVVSIELEGGDEPQTIFETLNSRGVDLGAGDLMRNFIFQRVVGLGQEEGSLRADKIYKAYWLPLDRRFWQEGETRGRLTRARLDWMLVDHLAMMVGDLISADTLFESYRKLILEKRPFDTVEIELKAIAESANIHKRVVTQSKDDPLGRFGILAKAFDVSTTMPLIIYLAVEANLGKKLVDALSLIESYIVRRDLCGLPTNNYNRFFVDVVGKLRAEKSNKLTKLEELLCAGKIDISRWPNNEELKQQWLSRPQYKSARQPRLRYIFEAIEAKKRSAANEVVEIKSDLTLEHIMPQKWREHWALDPTPGLTDGEVDIDLIGRQSARDSRINLMGNLTLLTQSLNSSVSNGPFSLKMPALRAQSALVLNRELYSFDDWDEDAISIRGVALLDVAQSLWIEPKVAEASIHRRI